jgi:hypothetical protein
MKKFNVGMLGLLAIPLAGLGIVGSVAFAQSNAPTTTTATPTVQTVQQTTADKEVPDAQEVGDKADGQNEQVDQADDQNQVGDKDTDTGATKGDGDGETNDDGATAGK